MSLTISPSFGLAGQNGNGGFVYKDHKRESKALTIIAKGIDELARQVRKSSEDVFKNLNPKVDQKKFTEIVNDTVYPSNEAGFRTLDDGSKLILMMDYKEIEGAKYIMVYAPMIVALMYMANEIEAKKFFQVQLIHEVLHYFSYSEDQADVAAPLLYDELFGGS